jgi:GT2 family glycosyltransferase
VVNDDVTVDPDRLAATLDSLRESGRDDRCLAFLDPVEPKPVPTIPDALLGLSLLGPVIVRLRLPARRGRSKASDTFRPFSFVAISRSLWDELGGLDEAFIYTFEDADFARRAHAAGATLLFPDDTGVSHRRYGTSTSRMRSVLPCAAVSTATYLQTLGMRPAAARVACLAALAVRTPLVLVAGIPKREHLLGIAAAAQAFVLCRRPHLPDYAAN